MFLHKSHIWEKSGSQDIIEMLLTNQIVVFLNQIYLQNKMMKYLIFCMVKQIDGN